ncbi:LADA_0E12244g1_1 [Lachancea dasiensis]|uniref:LADA_0E12244g1_1 n=1 Tax=Lachancea dasiensis TaxID=1072105 RepID=A0A1G4JF41_9SACH|nr:LADA_0E12244g1_1 [Lachancea dasiensis]
MELIQGFIQPPKVQSVDDTIPTLCDRVENATLLSDRRSAVLGLKSFSRDYREAVIASGLKPLISTLKKDAADEDSVKAILETLLILFIRGEGNADLTRNWISQQSRLRNGKYPSPLVMKQEQDQGSVDQFSLWIADFMTQSDEMVHLFVQLLEVENFHIKLYAIQLLEAFVASRASRTRDALVSLPIGISTLVSLLDDVHDPVRDEAILLLMAVANDSPHIQKLVAFDNIFERLFNIIQEEGGLRGSLVVSDCLSLIVNVLKYNTSNQTLFLETNNLPQMARLLNEPMEDSFYWNDQKMLNIKTSMEILQLTIERHNTTTYRNQLILFESHLLIIVLRLALLPSAPNSIRPFCLLAAADMIRDNGEVQQAFKKIDVPMFDPSVSGAQKNNTGKLVPVTELLLNWCFFANSVHTFEIRYASSELLKAFLDNNMDIQLSFIRDQIALYEESDLLGESEEVGDRKLGIFHIILEYDPELKLNPYKLYFAVDLVLFLFDRDSTGGNKDLMRGIKCEGYDDANEHQNTLGPIQTVLELLLTSFSLEDFRVSISYLSLLICWLYEDRNAVDDFLSNKAVLNSLISYSSHMKEEGITANCLTCMVLGVAYEFSTQKSPLSRSEVYKLLSQGIGVNNYFSKVKQFNECSLFTVCQRMETTVGNFETDDSGLPKVYFSPYFTALIKDNFYRVQTALKRGPEIEVIEKVSFESFEELQERKTSLEMRLHELEQISKRDVTMLQSSLRKAEEEVKDCQAKKEEAISNLKKSSSELETLRSEQITLSEQLKGLNVTKAQLELAKVKSEGKLKELGKYLSERDSTVERLELELNKISEEKRNAEAGINKMNRELFSLSKEHKAFKSDSAKSEAQLHTTINRLKAEVQKREEAQIDKESKIAIHLSDLEKAQKEIVGLQDEKKSLKSECSDYKSKIDNQDSLISKLSAKLREMAEKCKELSEGNQSKSSEINELALKSKERISHLETQVGSLQDKNTSLHCEVKDAIAEIESLQKSRSAASSAHKALFEENSMLKKRFGSFNLGLKDLKTHTVNFRTEVLELRKHTSLLGEGLRALQITYKEKSSELEKALQLSQSYKNDLKASQKEKTKKEEELVSLKDELNGLQLTKENLEAGKKEAERIISNLTNDYKELEKKLNEERAGFESQVGQYVEKENISSERVKSLELELLNSEESKEKFQIQSNGLIKNFEEKLKLATVELSSLSAKASEDSEKLASCQTDLHNNTLKSEKLESRCNGLEKELEHARSDLLKSSSGNEQIQANVLQVKEELSKTELQLKVKNDTIETLEIEVGKLTDECRFTADELSSSKTIFERERKSLIEDIDNLKAALKVKKAEFEKEREAMDEGSASVAGEYLRKIRSLEGQLEVLQNDKDTKLGQSESENVKMSELLRRAESRAANSANELEQMASRLSKAKEIQQTIDEKHSALMTRNLSQLEDYKIQLKDLGLVLSQKDDSIRALETMVESLESRVANQEQQHDIQETRLRDELQHTKDGLQLELENIQKLANEERLRLEEDSAKNRIRSEQIASELQDMSHELKSKSAHIVDLEQSSWQHGQLQKSNQEVVTRLEKVEKENEEHKKQLEREKQLNNDLSTELKSQQHEYQEQKLVQSNILTEKESIISSLRSEVEALKREKSNWKAGTDRSEIDDLMLLVSELDEKNSRYRNKLEDLGTNFTSDDDEDDDDDGDDDEDDNEDEDEHDEDDDDGDNEIKN